MENKNSNVIDIETKKAVGRPKLTEEDKVKKEKVKKELLLIKKAILPLVESGLTREQILTITLLGKEHLKQYRDKIEETIKEAFNIKAKNNSKELGEIKFKDFKYNKDGEIDRKSVV